MSGTIYGVLASVFVSLYAIYIKRILPVVDGNVWLLTFYNNVNAMLLFIPMMIIFGEFPVILAFDGLFSPTFWFLMTLGGVFGCGIGYVTGLQVSFNLFVTSKKRKLQIHQFTNLKCCKKAREPSKILYNDVLFLIYYFKKYFNPI